MVNITKHGREYKAPTPPTYYSCTCRHCGCEFEFSDRDTDYALDMVTFDMGSNFRPAFYIYCPECKTKSYEWHWTSETEG